MKQSDLEAIRKIFTDKKVLKSFNLKSLSDEQIKSWLERNLEHQEKYGYGLFSVVLKSNNEVIGDCGLEHTKFREAPCIEIGYDILSKFWNKGYATEAAQAVKDYAINVLEIDLRYLCSFIRKNNTASSRVSEKIGMHNILEYSKNGIDYFLYAYSKNLLENARSHNR
jgi:RimJ/RimL family protein N-acetyltransferase